jgi:hypothetical protein
MSGWSLPLVLSFALLGLAFNTGCATPGKLHLYSMSAVPMAFIHDSGPHPDYSAITPSLLTPHESVSGLAYDPFTDHFFLRLAPGNRIRVIDRPARGLKREFFTPGAPSIGGGDLAVWPSTGHLFLTHPSDPKIIELTRFGARVREIPLEGLTAAPAGIACDPAGKRLLVLSATTPGIVGWFDLNGHSLGQVTLERNVRPSLAYDSNARHYYAPLVEPAGTVGIFDDSGRLRQTLPIAADYVDVGPRSFVRMF